MNRYDRNPAIPVSCVSLFNDKLLPEFEMIPDPKAVLEPDPPVPEEEDKSDVVPESNSFALNVDKLNALSVLGTVKYAAW